MATPEMSNEDSGKLVSLESRSPFELRVDLGKHVPEADIRTALVTGDVGFIHSFTTGSAVDGPGIRVVAWLAGCQFRCLYCHNPDTWTTTNGIPVSFERAKAQLTKYRHGLKVMNGGLTISGGEPLMQHKFAVKLFSTAKEMGIHTALDTNGFFGTRLSDDDLTKVDLVLLDLKAWDPDRHRRLVGMDVAPVHDFARRLAFLKRPIWIRFVLVPGLTDSPDEVRYIADFAARLGNVERVDVLPFHQMGRFKWKRLGIGYSLESTEPPSNSLVESVCQQFKSVGLKAY
jgi:pyruvate formate lyase activating enzyme